VVVVVAVVVVVVRSSSSSSGDHVMATKAGSIVAEHLSCRDE